MATPQRPGWYPAPDGSGTEQWWNGASWSDAKRGVGGSALPGLPAYRPTPPPTAPGFELPPPLPPTGPPTAPPAQPGRVTLSSLTGGSGATTLTSSTPLIAVVLGFLGVFFFAPLGIVGIVLGIIALRRAETPGPQRKMAIAGIVTGFVGVAVGAVQLAIVVFAFANGYSSGG